MADTKAIPRAEDESPRVERWTREEAERRMHDLLASLPPPVPIEELAHQQGIHLPQRWDDLPRWPEDDREAREGFDEFLEELRHGKGDLRQWARGANSDDE